MIELALALVRRYLPHIIGGLLLGATLWYMHHRIYESGRDAERRLWVAETVKLERKSQELLKLKKHEADMIDQQNQERANNAIETYAKHYDELRAAASRIPERVFIATKTSCNSNAMPGTGENRSKATGGIGGTGKTELPEQNIRELNKTISMIEDMQLKCERVLNTIN